MSNYVFNTLGSHRRYRKNIGLPKNKNKPHTSFRTNNNQNLNSPNKNIIQPVQPINKEFSIEIPNRNKDRVWVIGGGPSLNGFNFSYLENEDVITINRSALDIPNAIAFVTMDYTFVDPKYAKCNFNEIESTTSNKIFILNQTEEDRIIYDEEYKTWKDSQYNYIYRDLYKFNNIYSSRRVIDDETGFGLSLENFCHGANSGFCGVQLAILMGYEEIYLMGFDFNSAGPSHYHKGYGQYSNLILKNAKTFELNFKKALHKYTGPSILYNCSKEGGLKNAIPYANPYEILANTIETKKQTKMFNDLLVVGFYTKGTLYETEAQKTIASCKKWNLDYDIVGVQDFGGWQANTRYKAKFMREMLDKHPDKRLLYVDCDAIIQQPPTLFKDYSCDIAVRWQSFRWRENECLSGTIYMENNERTRDLCDRWIQSNIDDPDQEKNIEQWNLDKIITEMKPRGLQVKCLPPEYTFIFDLMKKIYPQAKPVIEHFQASRKTRKKS